MVNFLNNKEQKIAKEFLKNGYVIRKTNNEIALAWIKKLFNKIILHKKKLTPSFQKDPFNKAHKYIRKDELNNFRISLMNKLNREKEFRKKYFDCSKEYLEQIVGNELVMQKRVNLSMQFPNDSSSLLEVHADVWSGDSPYETVACIPLVDCYKTKSMYILPFSKYKKYEKTLFNKEIKNSNNLFNKIKKDVHWLNVKYGEIVIFNQCLPHGNVVNKTSETRWSMNCRFKSVYSPYFDKKIGEFFDPITLKPISEAAIKYNFPKINT